MRYLALAVDFDGTLAEDGRVDQHTLDAMGRLRHSGRKLILVSGRQLDDLKSVFTQWELFDFLVLENGALLLDAAARQVIPLGHAPSEEFICVLRTRGVDPLSVGEVILSTRVPHDAAVLDAIRDLAVDAQVIFNKGAVMVLPTGIDKATGLRRALGRLRLSPHNVVGNGDAENDCAFLELCGRSAAVANALPRVKQIVDYICRRDDGGGVAEVIDLLVGSDFTTV